MDTCRVDGCTDPVKVKKEMLCGRHYVRLRRHGDAEAYKRRPKATCSVDGCDLQVAAQGLCDTHYRRQRRYGTTDAPERPTVCVVPHCGRPVAANALCDMHYRRQKSGRDSERYCRQCGTLLDVNAHATRKFCSDECRERWEYLERLATSRETQLKRYGLTVETYDAMLASQHGACAICGSTDPKGRKGSPFFVVDHDHATGAVRGLLCAPCNSGLGLLMDSTEILEKALAYLRRE